MPDEMSSSPTRPAGRNVSALPLATLRDCFGLLVAGPDPLALDGTVIPGLPARRVALDEVRDLLLADTCPPATRDAAWAVLVRRSRLYAGAWTVAAAGMALPALWAVCGRLAGHSDLDPADVQAEVLTGFLEAVVTVRVDLPRIAVRLRWAAYRAGLALTVQQRDAPRPTAHLFQTVTAAEAAQSAAEPSDPYQVLAGAVDARVLTDTEAELIAETRLDDQPISAWAARHAISPRQAHRLRDSAEQRLLACLTTTHRDDEPDVPTRTRATRSAALAAVPV
jgi:hypothetical protein